MAWKTRHLFKKGQPRNDFDVALTDENWNSEWQDIFDSQVVLIEMNLVKAEVSIWIRQLKAGMIQDMIFDLLTREDPIDEFHVKPVKSKKNGAEYCFVEGRLVDHHTQLHYLKTDDIIHKLVLRFQHVNFKSPNGKMDQRYTPSDAFLHPDFDPPEAASNPPY